jgi:hypothetical protein
LPFSLPTVTVAMLCLPAACGLHLHGVLGGARAAVVG